MFELFLVGSLVGYLNAGIVNILDFAMTKGHLLDFVREWIARRYARKAGIEELFDKLPEWNSFEERAEVYDQLYWNIAMERKRVTRFLCRYCMAGITYFPVFFIVVGYGSFSIYEGVLIFLISIVANFISIKWIA